MMMGGWGGEEQGWRKGPWTPEEDKLLTEYVNVHGEGRWSSVARSSGLNRSGKSCRLRWVNYLRPGLKRGQITPQEETIIIELHSLWGNKWSTIARYLPGRTDNEIKNYWRTHFKMRHKAPSHSQQKRRAQVLKGNTRKPKQRRAQIKSETETENSSPHTDASDHQERMDEAMQAGEDAVTTVHVPVAEDRCRSLPDHGFPSTWSDFVFGDEVLWGGLWSFDQYVGDCNKVAMQNQAGVSPEFACGGDPIYFHGADFYNSIF